MNVKDVVVPGIPKSFDDQAQIIYDRQTELENTYWKIEKRESQTVQIDSRYGQKLIKDFLWRITEEVGEALEAFYDFEGKGEDRIEKVREEIIDGLHFLVGLCILVDAEVWWKKAYVASVEPCDLSMKNAVVRTVYGLGLVGNTLKLKAWKQTDVATDIPQFYRHLFTLLKAYLVLCRSVGMDPDSIYDYYYRKSEVNLFRIRSKY